MKGMGVKMATSLLSKSLVKVAVQSYEQGKKDCEDGTFDEKAFRKEAKRLIDKQFGKLGL